MGLNIKSEEKELQKHIRKSKMIAKRKHAKKRVLLKIEKRNKVSDELYEKIHPGFRNLTKK